MLLAISNANEAAMINLYNGFALWEIDILFVFSIRSHTSESSDEDILLFLTCMLRRKYMAVIISSLSMIPSVTCISQNSSVSSVGCSMELIKKSSSNNCSAL